MTRASHSLVALAFLWTPFARAQGAGPPGPPADPGSAAAESPPTPAPAPASTSVQSVYLPFGVPAPGTDINAGLPSSSRPVTGDQRDTFDLNQGTTGPVVLRGSEDASSVIDGERPTVLPDLHLVKRGDTLWDLSSQYFQSPWQWPKIWKHNPQVKNPHWIYPGDQLRLRPSNELSSPDRLRSLRLGGGNGTGLINRRADVPRDTVFLRDQGFIGDANRDVWGELVGAVEEQMLLADGNRVYLLMRPGAKVEVGQNLTVFRSIRQPEDVPGARKPPGEVVAVSGTVRVERWDPKTRVARAEIIESVDVIERGAKIGPVRRTFQVVPPKKNTRQVEARVLTSLYPHVFMGQNQVVFLDRGSRDGLEAGNTLLVLRKGDTWRKSLATSTRMMSDRLKMDSPERVDFEPTPLRGNDETFPPEAVAELRVLRAEPYSAVALVTQSRRELLAGDRAVAAPNP